MPLKKHGIYRFLDFEVDLAQRSLRRDQRLVLIGARTFDLLVFFLLNPQRPIAKDELMLELWPGTDVEESNLSQHIFLLRKALTGAQSGDRLIVTIPGRGYQFTAPVTEIPEAETRARRLSLPPARNAKAVEPVSVASFEETNEHEEDDDSSSSASRTGSRFKVEWRHPGPWQVLALTAGVALLGFGGLFAWRWMHRVQPQSLSLVVTNFENATGDPQFDRALQTAATIDLQQSPFLAVASEEKVHQTLAEMKLSPDTLLTPDQARDLCARTQNQVYLTGSMRRFAQLYLVGLHAFDCATGRSLAASKGLASTPDGVVAVLDKVAVDLRRQLGEPAGSVNQFSKPLFAGRAPSLEALRAYAEARHLQSQGKSEEALAQFQRAVNVDPQFGKAFASLGLAYSALGRRDLAVASLTRAFALRETVSEPDRLAILASYNNIVTGDMPAAIRNYKDWTDEFPRNPTALLQLADLETQIGKAALALEPARRSLDLNPGDPRAYVVLARAQMHLGQFEQATDTCQQAIRRQLDNEEIHGFLLQIAFLRLDQPAMDEQFEWARNADSAAAAKPYMLFEQGLMDFAAGKANAALTEMTGAVDGYRKLGQSQPAEDIRSGIPRIEAELGLTEAAQSLLPRLSETGDSIDIPVAWAHVGETSRAEAILDRELEAHPTTTLWQEDFGPQVKAAIALNQHRPDDAVEALNPALPYDLRSFDVPALRGRAYLIAKQPDQAEAEFHKILDHPGIEPLSHNYPLAQLGLARALAQEGKTVEAGFAYKIVLQIWKDADPSLPRLKEAKAEYAHLSGEPDRSGLTASVHPARKPAPSRH